MKLSQKSFAVLLAIGISQILACGGGSSSPDASADADSPIEHIPNQLAACAPGKAALSFSGSATTAEEKTYFVLPVDVDASTHRIEVAYGWMDNAGAPGSPFDGTTFDLGLWDQRGYRSVAGFRGWSGDRQGRIDRGVPPVWVEAGSADRGYLAGPIEAGTWYVEIGIGAVVSSGSNWQVQVQCLGPEAVQVASPPITESLDPDRVANAAAGWYHGDLHMHGFHSNAAAADSFSLADQARAAGLDVLFYTDYVVNHHWQQLVPAQQANLDLLIIPGREIITYFGHANTHGETPSVIDYRHGFEDIDFAAIQALAKADGALFQVNHPMTFPTPLFEDFCRGCAFNLSDSVDWNAVDLIEVHNGPNKTSSGDLGVSGPPGFSENPFTALSVDFWEERLTAGFKVFAVSGSDSRGMEDEARKPVSGYGSSATAIYADSLSRPDIFAALQAGRAFVKVLGANRSPHAEMQLQGPNGQTVTYGGALTVSAAETATLTITITGGQGQLLQLIQNGEQTLSVPISSDPFVHSQPVTRNPANEGPLGTFWRFDISLPPDAAEQTIQPLRTVIGNPVFLQD